MYANAHLESNPQNLTCLVIQVIYERNTRQRAFEMSTKSVLAIVGAVVLIALFFQHPIIMYATQRHVVATVDSKDRVCTGGKEVTCKYLIYTDQGVFEDTDTLWYWKYDSSDVYGGLRAGQTYTFKVTGKRLGIMSWYPNIISYGPAK